MKLYQKTIVITLILTIQTYVLGQDSTLSISYSHFIDNEQFLYGQVDAQEKNVKNKLLLLIKKINNNIKEDKEIHDKMMAWEHQMFINQYQSITGALDNLINQNSQILIGIKEDYNRNNKTRKIERYELLLNVSSSFTSCFEIVEYVESKYLKTKLKI